MPKNNNILPSMETRGKELLAVIPVNGTYILGVYKGTISEFDILLRYRQKIGDKWSRIRTPKHIHWAVDVLIKHYSEPQETDQLLTRLLELWEDTNPINSEEERDALLNTDNLLAEVNREALQYPNLAGKGEYSVKFLILIAKLLMVQELTNRNDAYMFERLLRQLQAHNDIFRIVATATMNRR